MSSKDIMRKARTDEPSKNPSTVLRSQTRSKTLAKEENSDGAKNLSEKQIAAERRSKVTVKTSSTTSTKKKPGGESERQSVSSVTSRSKAPETSRSGASKSIQESSRTTDRDARTKPRGERKSDGEKRGISTIYMPKTSRSTKSPGSGESTKVSAASSVRSKDASVNATSSRSKDVSVKATSSRSKDVSIKATSSRSKDVSVKAVSSRSKDASVKATSSRSKDASVKATSSRSKDASVKATSSRSKDASVKVSATRSTNVLSKTTAYAGIKEDAVESSKKHPTSRRLPSRERRRSRTLSPSEVKVLRPQYAADGGIVGRKAVPAQPSSSKRNAAVKSDSDDNDYEYEDDFESYESDFEECTDSEASEVGEVSSESDDEPEPEPVEMRTEKQRTTISSVDSRKSDEERMLDSGHYDLAEARRRAARVESIAGPREAKQPNTEIIARPSISPYREERSSGNKSLPSSTDEGFEDARSGDFAKSPPMSQITLIDFGKIAENKVAKIAPPKVLTRGEKLLEMIKLDTVGWSILESKPVAYEEFIRTHGKMNSRQISVQTNEDNLTAETQTEDIECASKWTQFPTRCQTVLKNDDDIKLFNMERLGVGGENDAETASAISRPVYDVLQLNDFLGQAGKVMLSLLEERISGNSTGNENVHELPFSESIVKLSIDSVTFLADRPVTIIQYSDVSNRVLLTIHAPVDEDIETARDEDFVTDCPIGCVWNILQPSRPTKIFYSSSAITACCFHSASYNVVLAGLADGSISLWDLAEDESWHRKIVDDANKFEWVVRSPTYSSIASFDEAGHNSEIVALRVLSRFDSEPADAARNKSLMPIQICSLDDNGRLIVWSVLRNLSRAGIDDLGLSWWGDLRLVKSQEISLFSKKASERISYLKGFSDMHVDRLDKNALYIATNTPNILHATRIGKHANPPAYKSNEMDWCGDTRCIESCPFDQPYFMVGCADGTVRLHSTTTEKPLLQLKHEECKAAVKTVQWSRSKPLTLYVLDVDSKIHIWDLGNSDMFPVHTISKDDWAHIECIQLSPCRTTHEMTNQYMALASDNGCVEVHRLKEGFYYAHKAAVKQEMNTFLRYVAIL